MTGGTPERAPRLSARGDRSGDHDLDRAVLEVEISTKSGRTVSIGVEAFDVERAAKRDLARALSGGKRSEEQHPNQMVFERRAALERL